MNRYVLRRAVHPSWMIALAAVMVLAGAVMARWLPLGFFGSIAWFLTATGCLLAACVVRKVFVLPFAIVGGLLLGLWRGSLGVAELSQYRMVLGETVTVQATVSDDTDTDASGNLVLRLNNVKISDHALGGKIWVTSGTSADIKRGDHVKLRGKLSDGFGTFAATMYRATVQKVERPNPGDVARRVRDWFADAVRRAIPEPEASLGNGFLTGQRRALPPELSQALQIAGLTHIIVASGYNLTILVRLTRRLFARVSKYLAAFSAGTLIVSFVAITGLSPSMSRAGLVSGLSLLAWYYGRRIHPLVLLPFAAAVTVLVDPSYAWGDLGWELSFAAFGGVMLLAPLGQAYFFGEKKPGIVRQILGETIAATICTLPILILAFQQVSVIALATNLLILPFIPIAMLLTFVAGVAALAVPVAASIVGIPAAVLLGYMTKVTEWFAALPWALQPATITPLVAALMYIVIVAAGVFMTWRTKLDLAKGSIVE